MNASRNIFRAWTTLNRPRNFVSSKRTSPYAILGLNTNASLDEVKQSFRKLAKEHHPDLNPGLRDYSQMNTILSAYEAILSSKDELSVDNRVSMACEVMTLSQLQRTHNVFAVEICYHDIPSTSPSYNTCTEMSQLIHYKCVVHPDDSISDVKRHLESLYSLEWGLDSRRLDRFGLAVGWELVLDGDPLEILGNHWFLNTYQIENGHILYAVVRI